MRSIILIGALLLCSNIFAKSQITETVEYSEIFPVIDQLGEKHGKENVLVVFDIDDTLLVIEHCRKPDGTMTRGIGKLFSCPSEHTEESLANDIRRIQTEGFATLALTARGRSLIKATQRELKRRHSRKKTFIFKGKPFTTDLQKVEVPKTRRCKRDEVKPCLTGEVSDSPKFIEGVMYANGTHKGLALQKLLVELNASYDAIVFIDDRKKNTDNVHMVYKNQDEVDVHNFLYLRHRD